MTPDTMTPEQKAEWIEKQRERKRNVGLPKEDDVLRRALFQDHKVVAVQIPDVPSGGVCDGHVERHDIDTDTKDGAVRLGSHVDETGRTQRKYRDDASRQRKRHGHLGSPPAWTAGSP